MNEFWIENSAFFNNLSVGFAAKPEPGLLWSVIPKIPGGGGREGREGMAKQVSFLFTRLHPRAAVSYVIKR